MTVRATLSAAVFACGIAALPGVRAQQLKPETAAAFDCYLQAAEARIEAPKTFLAPMPDRRKVQTMPADGPNPHPVPGGQIYDWIGEVFIPGVPLDRAIRMMWDYDHRAQYLSDVLASSKLLCRSGENHFGFTMQLKEPAPIETHNDVMWERVDVGRWLFRSYSTNVRELGKSHGYLYRLNSYWRFAEADGGVYIQSETITLSGEFNSVMRALGSMMGINPEKSVRRTLESVRAALLKKDAQFVPPPTGLPACGEPFRPAACHGK